MAHFNLDLDLDKSQAVGQVVRARVGDVESCVIAATIYDHGSEVDLAGMGARFCMLKPDRTVIEDDGCEVSGSTVTHTLGTQATAAAGVAKLAYFEILDGSTVIDSTQCFRLVVEPDAEGSGTGPSEDYISRVDAATEAANDAAEAATGAAQSATTAAGAAETAADAANDAADAANEAAQRADAAAELVPEGGEPGQLLSKTADGTAWVDPPSGNVLTGEAEGYVAHADDAYAQKPREVRIKGKTWVNRWPVIEGTSNGITVSTDETGLVTITGTATGNAYLGGNVTGIAKNANVTIVRSTATTRIAVNVQTYNDSGFVANVANLTGMSGINQATGNTGNSDFTRLYCNFEVAQGSTVNASFRVMLVDGTEAPDCFTPPASIASVETGNLVTSGKNLWVNPTDRTTSGVTLTNNDDGSLTVSGTNTAGGTIYMGSAGPFALEMGKTYTISIDGDPDFSAYVNFRDSGGSLISSVSVGSSNGQSSATFSPPESTSTFQMGISVKASVTVSGTYKVMLNEGSTATAYEPPAVTQTPLPEVELRSLPNGTCDELVIKADGTCEVERRTGYIESYTDEEVTGEYVSTGNGLEAGASIVYELDEPTTESQSTVTLPTLPAPTFNQYHDSPVPSDTSTEYVRDINIAFSELQAQVSATTVREATNG